MADRTRILYITGWLRSGTTILGNVLNEVPGVVHVGELHYLWQNGLQRAGTNSLCGCGAEVRDCPLWSQALGDLDTTDLTGLATRMRAAQQAGLRTRHTRSRLADRGRPPAHVAEAIDRTAQLYRAVAARGGERLIVDSSKYPAEAAAMLDRPDLDVRVLHMVRDPRAIAYSYRTGKAYIEPMSASASTANWLGFNLASQWVGAAAGDRYLRVRHEDVTAAAHTAVAEIMRFAGIDAPNPVEESGAVTLGVNHTVTGNPDRLRQGRVTISSDERWRTGLDARYRVVTEAIATPLLRRYRYAYGPGPAVRADRVGAVPRTGGA